MRPWGQVCMESFREGEVGNDALIILWSQKIKLNEKEIEFIYEE